MRQYSHQRTFNGRRTALEGLAPDDCLLFVQLISNRETYFHAVLLAKSKDRFMDHRFWHIQRMNVRRIL
jgi:hypothetical protein